MKRVVDILLALSGMVILLPLILIISLLMKLKSPGPLIFSQVRVGMNENHFRLHKFRSMDVGVTGVQVTSSDDDRITDFGRILRKYKLDELPQLFNVLIGNMSLVGPRPEVPDYMKYYSEENQAIILSVKPGITDLASIEFRDESALLEGSENFHETYINEIMPIKEKYYTSYVTDRSFYLDLKIIFLTLRAIII